MLKRAQDMGPDQAQLFWAGVYTDNNNFSFIGPELATFGIKWKEMNRLANIWLADAEPSVGTCVVWIVGRVVINGVFGCLIPSKLQRAIIQMEKALRG